MSYTFLSDVFNNFGRHLQRRSSKKFAPSWRLFTAFLASIYCLVNLDASRLVLLLLLPLSLFICWLVGKTNDIFCFKIICTKDDGLELWTRVILCLSTLYVVIVIVMSLSFSNLCLFCSLIRRRHDKLICFGVATTS